MIEIKKVRTSSLLHFKQTGQKITCLTSYDALTAGIFDSAQIDVLLVGDSAADNSLGYESTLPITIDELIPFGRAVAKAVQRALVVVDLPFGSYELSPQQALENSIKVMKTTGADAVKLEGGAVRTETIELLVANGIPVMAHLGFTPQSVNTLGGFKVQGRGEAAEVLLDDAKAVQAAGAFAVVLEMIPAQLAVEVSKALHIPTIGIGAGSGTDGQILVRTDFAGLTGGKPRKFVRRFAEIGETLKAAAETYRNAVTGSEFPAKEHEFEG
jgi:3-methyl-2-oxobutanoate hydroxymethyltransferase